ncbi:MAG: GIY-YIG nuclease family protein [Castellaniella sp.]|uniref:GIY-YIG nuclease family protein n=1 Tax=Castellaniella sp. TaxID=1955812 RepID=UPI003C75AFBB
MVTKNAASTASKAKTGPKNEPLRLIQFQREWIPIEDIDQIPKALRGIYVLYKNVDIDDKHEYRNVVYVGMSGSGLKGRLRSHKKNKKNAWDMCSIFVVWPNVREGEIRELEGIMRHIFRFDEGAQSMNLQGTYNSLLKTPKIELSEANRKQAENAPKTGDSADSNIQKTKAEAAKKTAAKKGVLKSAARKKAAAERAAGRPVSNG